MLEEDGHNQVRFKVGPSHKTQVQKHGHKGHGHRKDGTQESSWGNGEDHEVDKMACEKCKKETVA